MFGAEAERIAKAMAWAMDFDSRVIGSPLDLRLPRARIPNST